VQQLSKAAWQERDVIFPALIFLQLLSGVEVLYQDKKWIIKLFAPYRRGIFSTAFNA